MARPVDPPHPRATAAPDASLLLRQAREATALRENLRRRKQQVRARQPAPTDPATDPTTSDLRRTPPD